MEKRRDASGTEGAPETGEEALEKRVRKVLHLDPFRLSERPDGRFHCELEKPPSELTPDEAGRILQELEPLLEQLRRRAGES